MANPPFAGDIKEPRMIARYDLAKKSNGKWETKVGRDILFIERNLDFLKPGGRMAIILPQGRFNNSSDKNIRDFIAERCRILAVVGLHGNTFKPHTGTKTSVLFVQKWNDDPKAGALCLRQDDYNIFFATMRKSGKDNSGDKIWRKISPSATSPPDDEISELMPPSPVERMVGVEGDFLQDIHGHLVVDHDLYNHEGLTEDGIAEAFIEFAKKENLSFFELSPSVTPFDAVKYQQLMDGLEAVEVQFSGLETLIRIDAEVYQKIYIEISEAIDKFTNTSIGNEIRTIKKGIFDIKAECYSDSGIPFVRISNLRSMRIDDNDIIYIPEDEHTKNIDTELRRNDVILSKTAYPAASLVTLDICNTSQDTVAIKLKSKSQILSHYLVTFLNSKYGYYQMQRWFTGNIQMHLNLTDCKEILIPVLTSDFQNSQKNLFEAALSLLEKSKDLYQQAEDLLLSELNLKDWQPTEETVAVKSFAESFLSSGRFDAEYYQPKFDQLYESLETACSEKGWELRSLDSLSSLFKYGTSEPFEYLEQGVPFLRIADLQKYRFSEKYLKFISQKAAKQQQANVKTGDVLISRSGTLGLAVVIPKYLNNAVYGSYFILTRPNQGFILPTYLALYLNSLVGKLQTEQANTGGIQTNLTIPVLESLLIACPSLDVQQRFVDKVNQSYDAEDKSKQLLEIAKTGVERAIETDEATATAWINQQLEALSINLTTTTETILE